jgi:hypothetical protein
MCNNFFPENPTVYETVWKKYGRTRQATGDTKMLRRKMRFSCRVTKARIHTNAEYLHLFFNNYYFRVISVIFSVITYKN